MAQLALKLTRSIYSLISIYSRQLLQRAVATSCRILHGIFQDDDVYNPPNQTRLQQGFQLFAARGVSRQLPQRKQCTYTDEEQRHQLINVTGGSVQMVKDEQSGIATVLVSHVERKNAFSGSMMVQLSDIVSELENWKAGRGVIVRGDGGMFCSGADLTLMKSIMTSPKGVDVCRYMQRVLTRLYRLPLVTVAFVEGKALGGGAEVSIACDFRAFARSSAIGFIQSKLGLSPGWGGGVRLVELIGRQKALHALSTGTIYNATEATKVGLADYVVEDGQPGYDEVLDVIGRLTTAISPAVQQAAKRVIVNASAVDFSQAIQGECSVFASVWGGPDHIRAMSSGIKFTPTK